VYQNTGSIIVELIYGVALLVALSVVSGFVRYHFANKTSGLLLQGLLFGLTAIIGMANPVVLGPGIIFDGRSVVVGICALFFGPVSVTVAGAMAAVYRLSDGGAGAVTGVLVILASAMIGLAFHYRRKTRGMRLSSAELIVFGIIIHVVMLLLMFTLPGGQGWPVLQRIALPVMLIYPLGTVLIGKIIYDQETGERLVAAIEESKEEFRTTIYSIGDALITTDRDGRVRCMNKTAEALTGWTESEAMGKPLGQVFSIIGEQSREPISSPVDEVIRTGAVVGLANHTTLISRDGAERPIADSAAPIRDKRGIITGVVLVFRDQSAERAAEMAIATHLKRLEAAEARAKLGSWEFDVTSGRGWWSRQLYKMLSFDPEKGFPTLEAYLERIHPEDRPLTQEVLERMAAGEEPPQGEFRSNPAYGPVRHFSPTVHRERDDQGNVIKFSGTVLDVTEQKHAEDALRSSEEKFRTLVQSAPDGIFVQTGGRFAYANDALVRLLDADAPEDLIGRAVVDYFHPDYRAFVSERIRLLNEERTAVEAAEEVMLTVHGEPIDVEVSAVPFTFDDEAGALVFMRDIRQRKEAEQDVRHKEYMLSRSEQIAHIGSWEWEVEPDIVTWSDEMFAIFGRDPEQGAPPYREHRELLEPEDLARLDHAINNILETGEPYEVELRVHRPDGEIRNCVSQGFIETDSSGKPVRLFGLLQDITERKKAEEEARRLSERLTRTLESITDAFYLIDREGRFAYINKEAERLLGQPRENLLDKFAQDEFPEVAQGRVGKMYRRAIREGRMVHFEEYYPPLNGWIEVRAYPSEEGLAVYFHDITQRRKAEIELQELTARLQGLLDHSPLYITEIDLEGRYLLVNKAVAELAGRSTDDLRGESMFSIWPESNGASILDRIQTIRNTGSSMEVEDRFTINGHEQIFETVLFPLFDEAGRVASIAGIARDVTREHQAEQTRKSLENQLLQAQKMEAVGRLAGGVAHDFNNMLGVILGHADMALTECPEDHPLHTDIEQIKLAAQRSADLTRQLLAFARKQNIAPKVLDLNETVSGMMKMLERLIGENITLNWRPGENLWPVKIDPAQLDQILANLAVNARDAIEDVGAITIETNNAEFDEEYCENRVGFIPGQYVSLTVSDDGCGMDKETLAQLFEPFFTTKPMGEGTGLGLATVYGIVTQNGGFINVYSEPDQGSTFRIYLSRYEGRGETAEDLAVVEAAPGTETVLLVEDEKSLLTLGERQLKQLGYTVLAATGPEEALSIAEEFAGNIDLLLTDVVMPGMNGLELWERVQKLRSGIRPLFMSGYTSDIMARGGTAASDVVFIGKPFSRDQLARKIREALSSE